jgi:hypothetical protein
MARVNPTPRSVFAESASPAEQTSHRFVPV